MPLYRGCILCNTYSVIYLFVLNLLSCFEAHIYHLFSGDYFRLVRDMRDLREPFFFTAFRMTPGTFDKLLDKIQPFIKKKTTRLRKLISLAERLAVTLRQVAFSVL